MKHIFEFLSKIFAFLLVAYVVMLIVTPDPCVKTHRSSIPVLYFFRLVDTVTHNWTSDGFKITLLKAEIASAVSFEQFFEKTFEDVQKDAKGNVIYQCNPDQPKKEKAAVDE